MTQNRLLSADRSLFFDSGEGSADAALDDAEDDHQSGQEHIEVGDHVEAAAQGTGAADIQLGLDVLHAVDEVDEHRAQHRAEGGDIDGDGVQPGAHLGRDSRNTDTPNTTAEITTTDRVRDSFRRLARASLHASIMFTREVMPAKNTDTKKRMANSRPAGICPKTWGRVTNMREGPLEGSMPKANTAGRMAKPVPGQVNP